jgi:MFS family permease
MSDSAITAPAGSAGTVGGGLREWRRGWPVVGAGMYGYLLVSYGMMAIGAFMGPVQQAFGWTRAEFSSGLTVFALIGIPMPPLIGMLIDRVGPRRVAAIGSLVAGSAFALFATASSSLSYWFALWLIYALANQLIMPTLWSTAVARSFVASRGFALGITMIGSALAALLLPIVSNLLIEHLNFRNAYLAMGLSGGAIGAFISWLAMPGPGERKPTAAAQQAPPAPLAGVSMREGLLSATFLKLALPLFFTNAMLYAMQVHLIELLRGAGLARDAAVYVSGSIGLTMIGAKIVIGLALDRVSGRLLLALCIATLATSLALLAAPAMTLGWAIAAVLVFGIAYGAMSPVYPYLISRYFGMRSFGGLFGVMNCLYTVAFALGPTLAGAIYDRTHSYSLLLVGAIPVMLVMAGLALSLGRYPDHDR